MGVWTTTPRTWAVSEVLTATNMNAQLRDFQNGFGAYTSFTPSVSGGWGLGNGTLSAKYLQVNKFVHFIIVMTVGSTTVVGTTLQFSLPVTIGTTSGYTFDGRFYDLSATQSYLAQVYATSTTVATMYVLGTNGLQTAQSSTVPFTWAAGDLAVVNGSYEAA